MGPQLLMEQLLLSAMTLATKLAIVKYQAHKTDGTIVTTGNTIADESAKKAVLGTAPMMALNPGEEEVRQPEEDNMEQIVEIQSEASEAEMAKWVARGEKKERGSGWWWSV